MKDQLLKIIRGQWLKNEYVTSCGYIHGGNILDDTLAFVFNECMSNTKFIKDTSKYYKRITKIFRIYDKMLISEYGEDISGCFHRRKTLLKYLLGNDCYNLIFEVIKQ